MHIGNPGLFGRGLSEPCHTSRPLVCNIATSAMQMGPVTTAVGLYAIERLATRIMAGQIHRKGVLRKIKRLMSMVLEFHMMCEIMQDVVEDICTQ